jgi:hypothetical protein
MQARNIVMMTCDLCGKARRCSPRQIEGKEYDICSECWRPLAAKLKGKGRALREREVVLLPPLARPPTLPEPNPPPGEPPKIWSGPRA